MVPSMADSQWLEGGGYLGERELVRLRQHRHQEAAWGINGNADIHIAELADFVAKEVGVELLMVRQHAADGEEDEIVDGDLWQTQGLLAGLGTFAPGLDGRGVEGGIHGQLGCFGEGSAHTAGDDLANALYRDVGNSTWLRQPLGRYLARRRVLRCRDLRPAPNHRGQSHGRERSMMDQRPGHPWRLG